MKNPCRKGKVHPSPPYSSSSSSSSSSSGWTHRDAYTVLRLLPVAIATLSAALPPDDQEVLAYLIARSPDVVPLQEMETKKNRRGAAAPVRKGNAKAPMAFESEEDYYCNESSSPLSRAEKRKASQPLRSHRASFECACFQCYTSFWRRWDASPSRQTIHEAIELFEDHMAAEAAGRHRGKNRKGSKPGKVDPINDKPSNARDEGPKIAAFGGEEQQQPEDSKPAPKSKQIVPFAFDEDAVPQKKTPERQQEAKAAAACPLGGRSLMRRMFPDFMGFVADHLWTAWSSPVRTANT